MSVVVYQMWLSLLALPLLILALGSDLILGTSCSVCMRLGFIWQGQFVLWFPPTGLHTVLYGRGSLCCGSHLLDYTQFYMAGAVYVVVPTYWTTHNFITQITTIKILWPGFLWFLPSPISRCHDSLLYYATSFLICLISAIENIIK